MSDYGLKVVRADDLEFFKKSVELQKTVYCDECCFEKREDIKSSNAFDDYDVSGQTRRALILNLENISIGTVRLIVPGELELPAISLKPELKNVINGKRTAECSAFCYSQTVTNKLSLSPTVRLKVVLVLIGALYALSKEEQVTHTVMIVQNNLFRYLQHLGIKLNVVGKEIYYHGERKVCLVDIEKDVFRAIQKRSFLNWQMMYADSTVISFWK